MTIHDEADAAGRILNDPVFAEAVSVLRADALEALLNTPAVDVDGIRETQALVKALDALTGRFRGVIEAAKVTQKR